MREDQESADAAEDFAIRRMRWWLGERADRWVKRLVSLALIAYFGFYIVASSGPGQHRSPSCLLVPTVVRSNC
jgi:hypothetical protein